MQQKTYLKITRIFTLDKTYFCSLKIEKIKEFSSNNINKEM